MKNQGNMTPPKEHNNFPVTDPKEIETFILPDKEFKIVVFWGIRWESARKKLEGPHGCFCQVKCPPHCTSSLCCFLKLSLIASKSRVISFNMDPEIALCWSKAVICRSSPEKGDALGGTQHSRMNLNAFAFSSVCTSWVGCPWSGHKQVEKLLRRNWNSISVWESQEPHLSSP